VNHPEILTVYTNIYFNFYLLLALSCLEIDEVLAVNSAPLTERLLAHKTGA
jgi:hypothetical protein